MEGSLPKRLRASEPVQVAVVGGAGHGGLPLSLVIAESGHRVAAIDSDATKLEAIRAGQFPFQDVGGKELLARALSDFPERLHFTTDYAAARGCNVIVVAVGTPVDEHLNPELAVVEATILSLKPFLRNGQTIVLRSTVFPGTTARILAALRTGGCLDVGVGVCPERHAEGQAIKELKELPQIVSGSDARALSHAKALFAPLGVDLVELDLEEAEVSKLFLNAWRYVVLGSANQFYQIASSKGLDFNRIRAAIMHKYERAAGFPQSGFTAGPNLFRDTMQLAALCRHTFSLGHAAMLVNETMPDTLLEQAKRDLAQMGRTLAGMKCGILGMAFKPDSDDTCESLAFKLRRLLLWEGAEVVCSDARLQREGFVGTDDLLAHSDVVFIGCPHSEYRDICYRAGQRVFDCWGVVEVPRLAVIGGGGEAFRALRVAVVGGAGHVGLPLSLVLAERGHRVTIVDTNPAKLEAIREGRFPFLEAGGPELLARCHAEFPERLRLTEDYAAVRECDVIIMTIGTPVDEHLNPCFSVVEGCIKDLRPFLRSEQTLVLRSTLFPGTSARIVALLRATGVNVSVSFCPERIAQGCALEELTQLPQIVSGSDPHALEHAKALFTPLGVDVIELDLQEAESAKLFLNAWRYVVFGTANQFYHMATSRGLDFDRIREAIMHKYPRAIGFPQSGFTAGPCLFKDTMQLAAYCRHTFSLGHAAMLVNETMPDCVVQQAQKELSQRGRTLAGARCGILGMAFKPDNDDSRESLAFKLRRLLLWEGAEVLCSDVYIWKKGFVDADKLLAQSEFIFMGCPHHEYRKLKFREGQQVFSCWGAASDRRLAIAGQDPPTVKT